MRITEITNAARKLIKEMESLYINYSVNDSIEIRDQLSRLADKNETSEDNDVSKQAKVYKNKLFAELIQLLRK